jgi:hypothetical protein
MINIRVTERRGGDLGPEPKVVLTFDGSHDVGRIVYLLSRGLVEHVAAADGVVSKLRALPSGVEALELLTRHGGPDYMATYPGGFDPDAEAGERP